MERIRINDVAIEVKRSPRRKTVELMVERDGRVVFYAPQSATSKSLESLAREKLVWIYRKLGRKEEELHHLPGKECVSGEGFYYLGRKYRLKLLDDPAISGDGNGLRLQNGRFLMPRELAPRGRDVFVRWYTEQALDRVSLRMKALKARVAAEPESIHIRDLSFRWGSCTHKGKMFFHWRIILLPQPRVDYLIMHELVHLHEHNHSPAFYERLARAVPDYAKQEDWLRRYGDLYSI
jgi:predicted metal-dependent hydrolase